MNQFQYQNQWAMELIFDWKEYLEKYKYKKEALYYAIIDLISHNKIPKHTRLPSSRELSTQHSISRGIVSIVYETLIADGYLISHPGKGTFTNIHFSRAKTDPLSNIKEKKRYSNIQHFDSIFNKTGDQTGTSSTDKSGGCKYDFRIGMADMDSFPCQNWKSSQNQAFKEYHRFWSNQKADPKGVLELRIAIANHVSRHRGFHPDPSEIFILNGSQMAIQLICQLLVKKNHNVVIEDPCYTGIRNSILYNQGKIISSKIEKDGIEIADWNSKLLFLTPGNHFPTGAVLSLAKRRKIVAWALKKEAYIVEDDFDSEFRYSGIPLPSLKSLDSNNRVIFIGSFSKSIGNFLRLGYMILPGHLIKQFLEIKSLYEPFPGAILEQLTVAQFIRSLAYEKHLRKMNKVLKNKYELLMTGFRSNLPDCMDWNHSNAGMHIYGSWTAGFKKYKKFHSECESYGILWTNPDKYHVNPKNQINILMGFSHFSHKKIRSSTDLMGKIYKKL